MYLTVRFGLLFGSSLWYQYTKTFFRVVFFSKYTKLTRLLQSWRWAFLALHGSVTTHPRVGTKIQLQLQDESRPYFWKVFWPAWFSCTYATVTSFSNFLEKRVLAIHSAENWSRIHIHNITSMNSALHTGMRLRSLPTELKIHDEGSSNARNNNIKIREENEVME